METQAPTTEGRFGRTPAICPAPVGLAPIPADTKLVRKCVHTKAASSTNPSPRAPCCARAGRRGGTFEEGWKKTKGETKRIVEAEKRETARWEKF